MQNHLTHYSLALALVAGASLLGGCHSYGSAVDGLSDRAISAQKLVIKQPLITATSATQISSTPNNPGSAQQQQ
jgi:hypothetical protein